MRRILLIIFGVSVFTLAEKQGFPDTSKKYPYELLTPDYGIVTEDDLAYDDISREIGPYDPNRFLGGSLYWQCFPIKEVAAKLDSWRGTDGMGAWNKIYTMCTFEIDVHHSDDLQIFSGRRALRIEACRDYMRAWKQITHNQNIVCLNGEGGGYEKDPKDGKYKLWTWVKFKTKKGCYSYFANECKTRGCSMGHCRSH